MPLPLLALAAGAARVGGTALARGAAAEAGGGGAAVAGRALQYGGGALQRTAAARAVTHQKPAEQARPTMDQAGIASSFYGSLQPDQFGY